MRLLELTKSQQQETQPIIFPTQLNATPEQTNCLKTFPENTAIRRNRVIELKERVQQGTFGSTNDKIAETIINQTISIRSTGF